MVQELLEGSSFDVSMERSSFRPGTPLWGRSEYVLEVCAEHHHRLGFGVHLIHTQYSQMFLLNVDKDAQSASPGGNGFQVFSQTRRWQTYASGPSSVGFSAQSLYGTRRVQRFRTFTKLARDSAGLLCWLNWKIRCSFRQGLIPPH